MADAAGSVQWAAAGPGRKGTLHPMKLLLVVVVAALAIAPAAFAGPSLRVGAVEDAAIWSDPGAEMDLAKLAGFDTIRMTAQWTAGATALPPGQVSRLQRAALFASMRGLNPIVSIYNPGGSSAPSDPGARAQFVEFAKTVVTALPWVTTFIVGNEPNSGVYWQPQFDATGGDAAAKSYEALLAATYDGIKAARPTASVIGGALDSHGNDVTSHSPTTFIRDLGLAYRASGRKAPLMDVFDEHVYADTSALPPSMPHIGTTIAEGDYARLVALLGKAFDGTAQRGSKLPIFYGEYGVETTVPADEAHFYAGSETQKTVDEATQARYYAEAFRLALCQPNVIGIMVFHVVDETALGAWQSGPFYSDGTPKSSLPAIRAAALAARGGSAASCPDRSPPAVVVSTTNGNIRADASDGVGVGKVSLFVNGRLADVKYASPYVFSWTPKRKGRYKLEVRAADAAGNVGLTAVTVAAAHARRGEARTPTGWLFTRARPKRAR
jgi:hypothetical protein